MSADRAIAEVEFVEEFDAKGWASAFVPLPNKDPHKLGRKSKYTRSRVANILQSLYDACPDNMAGQRAGISRDTFYEWKKKSDFSDACGRATALGLRSILGVVTKSVRGRGCNACQDGIRQDEVCPACKGSTYAVKPDGRLGLMVAERRVAGYARKDTVQVQHTGTVELTGNVSHTHMHLEGVSPEDLQALAWGKPLAIADVIEAGE